MELKDRTSGVRVSVSAETAARLGADWEALGAPEPPAAPAPDPASTSATDPAPEGDPASTEPAAAVVSTDDPAVPSKSWKVATLKAYAEERGIDLGAARTKDEILPVITAATTPATADPEGDESERDESEDDDPEGDASEGEGEPVTE